MLSNFFKTAFRNLWKNKGYSFINIFGLSVGMAVALLIGLWVQHQLNFDDFHKNKKDIAILMKKTYFNNIKGTQTGIMLPLYDELKANYPEVKRITRKDWGGTHSLVTGDKKFNKRGNFVDPDFLRMFTFPLIKGSQEKALDQPYSVIINESTAKVIFGDEDPMGKTLKLDNAYDVAVTGVMKDVPKNSSMNFEILLPYELNVITNDFVKRAKNEWQNNFLQNIVQLNEGVNPEKFSKRIENIVREKTGEKTESQLFVHPMAKWHLYNEFKDWVNTGGAITYVRLFAIIGLFVLMIACINFMNLSTARSAKRAREVGVRKALGSQRRQLTMQFLTESILTALLAFVISLLIVKLTLPLLSNVGFEDIRFNISNLKIFGIALAGCLLTGLLAGFYPAIYLSGFNAVRVLKGTFNVGSSASLPRKILVVTQFSFSIILIISTLLIFKQIQHAKNRPLGYDPNNLLLFSLSTDLSKNYDALKRDLLSTGYVEAVSKASSPMTSIWNQWDNFSWAGKDPNSKLLFSALMVDYDYEKTSGIKMTAGRFFSRDFSTDSNSVVLNEAAVKLIGFDKPVGSTIKMDDKNLTVVGVSENMVMEDPFRPVVPAIMLLRPYFISQGFVKIKNNANIQQALSAMKPIFEKHNPAFPFDYAFTDEQFDWKFRRENQVGQLAAIFAVLSIFISCLGLFGLAAYMAERRIKEIGIRKVLGASVARAWFLLSKEFFGLVLISCFIAIPIAVWILHNWLQNYDYRISIGVGIPIMATLLALLITLLTVSFQAIRAAVANPVKSLRAE